MLNCNFHAIPIENADSQSDMYSIIWWHECTFRRNERRYDFSFKTANEVDCWNGETEKKDIIYETVDTA